MSTTADVRTWAISEGHPVGASGHLPGYIIDLYNTAHPTDRYTSSRKYAEPDTDRSTVGEVRTWATRDRGLNIRKTGNLPRALIEAYNAAHPDRPCPLRPRHDYSFRSSR